MEATSPDDTGEKFVDEEKILTAGSRDRQGGLQARVLSLYYYSRFAATNLDRIADMMRDKAYRALLRIRKRD